MKVKALKWIKDRDKKYKYQQLLRVEVTRHDIPMNMEFKKRFDIQRGEEYCITAYAVALDMLVLEEECCTGDRIISDGIFPADPRNEEGEDSKVRIAGTVIEVQETDDKELRRFILSCFGERFHVVMDENIIEFVEVKTGDKVAGVFSMVGVL